MYEVFWLDVFIHDGVNDIAESTQTLEVGIDYEVTVTGNYAIQNFPLEDWYGTPDLVLYPSPGAAVGHAHVAQIDPEVVYARPTDAGPSNALSLPRHNVNGDPRYGNLPVIVMSVGSGFAHREPVGGPFSVAQPGHIYTYSFTGEGQKLRAYITDYPYRSDNSGMLKFEIGEPPTVAPLLRQRQVAL